VVATTSRHRVSLTQLTGLTVRTSAVIRPTNVRRVVEITLLVHNKVTERVAAVAVSTEVAQQLVGPCRA